MNGYYVLNQIKKFGITEKEFSKISKISTGSIGNWKSKPTTVLTTPLANKVAKAITQLQDTSGAITAKPTVNDEAVTIRQGLFFEAAKTFNQLTDAEKNLVFLVTNTGVTVSANA